MTEITHAAASRSVVHRPELSGPEQFELWNSAINATFVPLHTVSGTPEAFDGHVISQPVGQTLVCEVAGGPVQVRRSRRDIAAHNPGWLKLGLQVRGSSVVTQDEREAALTPGDFALYDTSRPYALSFADPFAMLVLMFPPQLLGLDPDLLRKLTACRLSGRTGTGALTASLLGALGAQLVAGDAPQNLVVSDAVLTLIRASLTERISAEHTFHHEGATLRRQAERYIVQHATEPELTVAGIAAANHVSVRYLQKLFAERGTTVSDWIRQHRLDQCRQELTNPTSPGTTVAAVGRHWGFPDASSFSRAFKARFGCSPTVCRHASPTAPT